MRINIQTSGDGDETGNGQVVRTWLARFEQDCREPRHQHEWAQGSFLEHIEQSVCRAAGSRQKGRLNLEFSE